MAASAAWPSILVGLCIAAFGGTASESSSRICARSLSPSQLVLRQVDVGGSYVINSQASGRRSLAFVSAGDSLEIRRALSKTWAGGYQRGFNGIGVAIGIVSSADVFRLSRIGSIFDAWSADARKLVRGKTVGIPAQAPGTRRVLIRGSYGGMQTLVYMWEQDATIESITLTGTLRPGDVSFLLSLAERQSQRLRICP